jgi:hypothetical protein
MRYFNTFLLLLLVGGLGFYILRYEREQPDTKQRAALEGIAFNFDAKAIDSIKINSSDKPIELRLKDNTWEVTSPMKDRANPELVQKLLEGMAQLEWIDSFKRKDLERDDYRRTGMATAIEVRLLSDSKTVAQCRIGGKGVLEDSVYVGVGDEKDDHIHLARTSLDALIQKSPDDWRDEKLVRLKAADIRRFSLSAGNGAIEFTREAGQPWQLVKPLQTRASDERVNAVIAAILNLKISPGKDAVPPSTSARSQPPMKIKIEAAGEAAPVELTLDSSPDPADKVRAEVSQRPGDFFVSSKTQDLWKLQPNHLRDQHLASIKPEVVTKLRLRSLQYGEVVLNKEAETWMLTRFGKKEAANQERIQHLFDKLNVEQIREFTSDAASNLEPYGLKQPFLEIEWEQSSKPVKLYFGSVGTEGAIYARYEGEPFIYRVNPLLFSAIPPDTTKWRGLKIINASLFSARRIIIAAGALPSMQLLYQPDEASWKATVADKDVTESLDKAKANKLLEQLVSFTATEWSSDRSAAYEALKNPSLTVQLLLKDPAKPDSELKPLTLIFAPTAPGRDTGVYHGRLEGEPDTFLISRDQYRELLTPLLK